MNRRNFFVITSGVFATSTLSSRAFESDPSPLPTHPSPIVSFGLMTDCQYADIPAESSRDYRSSLDKLKGATLELSGQKLAFSFHLGDLIDRDVASFTGIIPLFGNLNHHVYHAFGNHDFSIADEHKASIRKLLDMPADYYAFTHAGIRFVVLDTNEISTYKYPKTSEITKLAEAELKERQSSQAPNAYSWNARISQNQLDWLNAELTNADESNAPVIVCGHHPILPDDGHALWNATELKEMLLRHDCVCAYFCGHNHTGAEVVVDGLPFITFKSMVNVANVTSYAVIRIFENELTIEGRGREKSRSFPLRKPISTTPPNE